MSAQLVLDLADSTVVSGVSVQPQNIAANLNGGGVDFQQSDLTVQALCNLGQIVNIAVANTVTFSFQEASDNATWTNIADPRATLTALANIANTLQLATFSRTKRYVRGVVTLAGTPATVLTQVILLAQQRLTNPSTGFSYSPQT